MTLTLRRFIRVLNSGRLPSQMREGVPTGIVLIGAWDRWFQEHRGLGLHLVPTLARWICKMRQRRNRLKLTQVDRTQSLL